MAGFYQFFTIFLIEFINIAVYIRGWVGVVQVLGGWWQKLKQRSKMIQIVEFRVAMTCTCTHKEQYSATRPRQICNDSWSHIRSPKPNWRPPFVPFHQSRIYMVDKKHSGKANQSTLASGGSEHA